MIGKSLPSASISSVPARPIWREGLSGSLQPRSSEAASVALAAVRTAKSAWKPRQLTHLEFKATSASLLLRLLCLPHLAITHCGLDNVWGEGEGNGTRRVSCSSADRGQARAPRATQLWTASATRYNFRRAQNVYAMLKGCLMLGMLQCTYNNARQSRKVASTHMGKQ